VLSEIFRKLDEQGYVVVEKALEGDLFAQTRDAFYRVEQQTHDDWARGFSYGNYGAGPDAHVVYPIIGWDEVFLDLLELPLAIDIVRRVLGPDMMMIDNALHVKPAGTKAHTGWHRDAGIWEHDIAKWDESDRASWRQMGAVDRPHHKIKVFFLVEDVGLDTGPFSVVPGSHKLTDQLPPTFENLEDMPDHVRVTGPAGAAIIWNGCIWHTAMDNTDVRARRMLCYNYTHFGDLQHKECVVEGEFRRRMTNERSSFCKQLLGIERT